MVAARSPVTYEETTQQTRVKSSPRSSSELFSRKIESERPVAVIRTDSSRHVTSTSSKPPLLLTNTFVPISVAEQYSYVEDELSTLYDYRSLQLLQASEQQASTFSETVSVDTCDHHAVGVELLKKKKSTLDVQQKAVPQGYKMIAEIAGPQIFSDTLSIDACDHQVVEMELLKKKKSTLDVQQKAVPQGYKLIAEIAGPQIFSDTLSIDACDHQVVEMELLKKKKSTLDVQQKALPQGYTMIAEVDGPQIFSETLSIDACDHQAVGVELLKKKKSTLDVQQKALPQGYTMIAEVDGPQVFSETVSVDAEDCRPVGIELLKLKTSVMDVQRKAEPRGVTLEAVLEPKPQTTKLYIARTKCIEASVEKPAEQPEEGGPPVFVVQLQSLQTMDGGKARLVCRVRGRPMPVSTEWSRDGKIIPVESPEYAATYDEVSGDASLTIAEVFPEDAGVYECYAENKYGHAITKAELIVEGLFGDSPSNTFHEIMLASPKSSVSTTGAYCLAPSPLLEVKHFIPKFNVTKIMLNFEHF